MLHLFRQRFCRDTTLLYLQLMAQATVLVLSLARIDPGFWPKTTPARLYAHTGTNLALILVLAVSAMALKHFRGEDRRTAALVIAGVLGGLGAASAWGFDPGLFGTYLTCAGSLFWSVNPRSRCESWIVIRP